MSEFSIDQKLSVKSKQSLYSRTSVWTTVGWAARDQSVYTGEFNYSNSHLLYELQTAVHSMSNTLCSAKGNREDVKFDATMTTQVD